MPVARFSNAFCSRAECNCVGAETNESDLVFLRSAAVVGVRKLTYHFDVSNFFFFFCLASHLARRMIQHFLNF